MDWVLWKRLNFLRTVAIYICRLITLSLRSMAPNTVRADRKRDRELNAEYSLYVFHIAVDDAKAPDRWLNSLSAFLDHIQPTRDERWAACEMKTPWL
ncbi:hypothetical protein LCGC14_2568170 [marine sediment metagenome]|uniref:Uncharacterized protein n=1 Tax=marine sediment metagenome TaxID=412755 RepID=A0A0F9B5Z8_9ZZZZ